MVPQHFYLLVCVCVCGGGSNNSETEAETTKQTCMVVFVVRKEEIGAKEI